MSFAFGDNENSSKQIIHLPKFDSWLATKLPFFIKLSIAVLDAPSDKLIESKPKSSIAVPDVSQVSDNLIETSSRINPNEVAIDLVEAMNDLVIVSIIDWFNRLPR